MVRFLAIRVAWGVGILFAVTGIVFLIFYALPSGDPAAVRVGHRADPEQLAAVREALGLDRSPFIQYGIFLRDLLLDFDLGFSYQSGVSVNSLIADRLPATLLLVGGAAVVWLGAGILAGVLSAGRPGSLLDRAIGAMSLGLISAPVFWLGYLALYMFALGAGVLWPVFPGVGSYIDATSFGDKCAALILPWLVLGLSSSGLYARLVRATVRDELERDHVVAARARGMSESRVLWRHGARTGMTPVLTLLGIDLGFILIGNALLVEITFNIPGLGSLLMGSVERADLPIVQGVILVVAVIVIVANLAVDILYTALDPRVRLR